MANSVLITGASGLVGKRLTEILIQKGYQVSHLGRSNRSGAIPSFVWDVDKGQMDAQALQGVDAIINLAGTGVAEKRWTPQRKKEILESRTKSCTLLYETLKRTKHRVKALVSASAIGYYGYGLDSKVLTEESLPGNDYLSKVVVDWEKAIDSITSIGIRVVKIRIGIVLSERGGALIEMARPVKWGIGSPLGSGKQMVSWVHLDDLCGIIVKAVGDDSMKGAYNAVAPRPVTNREITKAIGKVLKRAVWLPNVPGFVLSMVVGEMAAVVVNGATVSSDKIQRAGYEFQFTELDHALDDLMRSPKA